MSSMSDTVKARYPQLLEIRLEGEHRGPSELDRAVRVSYDNDLPSTIPCPGTGCEHTYDLDALIAKLTSHLLKKYMSRWRCEKCTNVFSFSLWLKYHERRENDVDLDDRVSAAVFSNPANPR
jgi:hypothetical protein